MANNLAPTPYKRLQAIKLPTGQIINVPSAIIQRIQFDSYMSGSGATINDYFGKAPKQGTYSAYVGLNEFVDNLNKTYSGKGSLLENYKPYQEMQKMQNQYTQQQQMFKETGAARKITMTASGETLSDTGPVTSYQDVQNKYYKDIYEQEKLLKRAVVEDRARLSQLTQSPIVSNLPINVRSNTPNIRSSMALHLQKIGALNNIN